LSPISNERKKAIMNANLLRAQMVELGKSQAEAATAIGIS